MTCFNTPAQSFWAGQLLAHWSHETFLFEDNPAKLTIGFSCACSGQKQSWSTRLTDFKGIPIEVHELIKALRLREQSPGSPWYEQWVARQKQLMLEAERTENLLAEMVKLDYKLNKRMSHSKRTRLRRKRNRLARLLREGNPAKVMIHEGPLKGKLVNAV